MDREYREKADYKFTVFSKTPVIDNAFGTKTTSTDNDIGANNFANWFARVYI